MNNRPLILVTNDDGIEAKGLRELTAVAMEYGRVVVISSHLPMSGMSHAITIKVPLRVSLLEEKEDIRRYITSGTPVDGVKLAFNCLLGRRPDLLLSGFNHGSNSSSSILYSGTMAAAMEGAINHVPSIGFSLLSFDPDADFGPSSEVAREVIGLVLEKGLPDGICLNVNIPSVPGEELKGIRMCSQANGYWKEEFERRIDPNGREYYWLTGFFQNREPEDGGLGTDEWALERKYVSVVPINTDMTSYSTLERLRSWQNAWAGNEDKKTI
ncbi:MAG: 5'/3'-nucleotidase SurE [Bacteroidetes bacterium]|nr:MAG: 5'/3'-nucleotidase SurE [Bacteroidota bacterium]